ncbi:MAG: alkylmercury lyase family protein [Actinomycetota bacterium]|nr:alkylmercury lyase family protein [Actinomycetota bacterium]
MTKHTLDDTTDHRTDRPRLQQLLEGTGVPVANLVDRRNSLPPAAQVLHRLTLRRLAATGISPTGDELRQWAAEHGAEQTFELAVLLRELREAQLLFTRANDTEVVGGIPFAAGTSAHRVTIDGGPEVFANCAVDALGIAAMVGAEVTVTSTDPHTGAPVTVRSHVGTWAAEPATAVVFVGTAGDGPLTQSCCPVINFFTEPGHAGAYKAEHGLDGEIMRLEEAAALGAAVFGDALS